MLLLRATHRSSRTRSIDRKWMNKDMGQHRAESESLTYCVQLCTGDTVIKVCKSQLLALEVGMLIMFLTCGKSEMVQHM